MPRASACTVEEERVDKGFDYLLSHLIFSPFAIVPLWNRRGESDDGYFADTGLRTRCAPSDASRCVRIGWISQWRPLGHADLDPLFWHGTLLQDKRTETRTFYRRNRYYDPATGQFTQEDPIGLAGGLNLYGFANGDPVNFSDPFGLCPPQDNNYADCATTVLGALGGLIGGGIGGFGGGAGGLAVCSVGGPVAVGCAAGGGLAGAAVGAGKGAAIGAATGSLIDAGIFMFSQRANAVNRAEGLRRTTDEHVGKLRGDPNSRFARGWRKEINAHLDEISRLTERMGHRTGDQWREYVQNVRDALNRMQ